MKLYTIFREVLKDSSIMRGCAVETPKDEQPYVLLGHDTSPGNTKVFLAESAQEYVQDGRIEQAHLMRPTNFREQKKGLQLVCPRKDPNKRLVNVRHYSNTMTHAIKTVRGQPEMVASGWVKVGDCYFVDTLVLMRVGDCIRFPTFFVIKTRSGAHRRNPCPFTLYFESPNHTFVGFHLHKSPY